VRRLFTTSTVEERMLQLVERRRGMEAVLKPGPTRGAGASSKLLEEILKWGTAALSRQGQQQEQRQEEGAEGRQQQQADAMEVDGGEGAAGDAQRAQGAQHRAQYSDQQMQLLVERASAACLAAAPAGGGSRAADAEGPGSVCSSLAEGLAQVALREWADVGRSVLDDPTGGRPGGLGRAVWLKAAAACAAAAAGCRAALHPPG
jgi:hypothetical protein